MNINHKQLQQTAKQLIKLEAKEVSSLSSLIDDTFSQACRLLLATKGRVVVMGMGKSGHIGNKIAATLASTGTPAFFVHPAEAQHGDLGMITANDTVLLLSYSGETQELVSLLPFLKRLEVAMIAITGQADSTLAKYADAALVLNISKEACPHNLAPTSSSTATLVLGDALAIALLEARSFSPEDFAKVHPGGALGKRLLTVRELMHNAQNLPKVCQTDSLATTLQETSNKKLGICFVVDANNILLGLFTDGDLRRSLQQQALDTATPIAELMTQDNITVRANLLAAEAITLMEKNHITVLAVIDDKKRLVGAVHMHDLLQAKII